SPVPSPVCRRGVNRGPALSHRAGRGGLHLGLAPRRRRRVMKTFSIVVPVYQNRANLPETVPTLLGLADALPGYRLELVLVDDGSTDGSRDLVLAAARAHPGRVKAVLLTRNFGQTAATQAGLRHASGNCVGIISCDLQEPPALFVEMVRAWEG